MPAAGKAHHTENGRKFISVSPEEALEILAVAKRIDPEAHIVEVHEQTEGYVSFKESKWYRDVKSSWHPGVTLRIRRENAGYTQAALASMTGIAAANISAIENGHRSMGLNAAKKFAEALQRPVSEFIEEVRVQE